MSTIDLQLVDATPPAEGWRATAHQRWLLHAQCDSRHAEMTFSKQLVAAFPELMQLFTERLCREVRPDESPPPHVTAEHALVNELMTMFAGGTTHAEVYYAVESFYRQWVLGEAPR